MTDFTVTCAAGHDARTIWSFDWEPLSEPLTPELWNDFNPHVFQVPGARWIGSPGQQLEPFDPAEALATFARGRAEAPGRTLGEWLELEQAQRPPRAPELGEPGYWQVQITCDHPSCRQQLRGRLGSIVVAIDKLIRHDACRVDIETLRHTLRLLA